MWGNILLAIGSFAFVIVGLFRLWNYNPNRTDHDGEVASKKRLIVAVIFFSICGIFFVSNIDYHTTEEKEAEYLNAILKESNKADKIMKEGSNAHDLEKVAQKLDDKRDNIKELNPPKSLPKKIRDSQDTLEDGLKKTIEAIRNNDSTKLEKGQTAIAMALSLYVDYIDQHKDIEERVSET